MWILRYKYELEDGTLQSISCCMNRNQPYSIGRSSKNPLNIKNDKSISRSHISISWDNQQLHLVNQGKLTAAGGKYLKTAETMDFKESDFKAKPIVIELGTKPLKVEIIWQDVIWDIPSTLSQFANTLYNLGIQIDFDETETRPTALVLTGNHNQDWSRCLFGLIHGIPLKNSQFLIDVCEALADVHTNFDEIWANLTSNQSLAAVPYQRLQAYKDIFRGLKFLVIENDLEIIKHTERAIKRGNGDLMIFADPGSMLSQLKSEEPSRNIIIISAKKFEKDIAREGIRSHTVEDIKNAVLDSSITCLLGGIPQIQLSPKTVSQPTINDSTASNSDRAKETNSKKETNTPQRSKNPELDQNVSIENMPRKKRRLNRPKVKPLDSLMFFAGGEPSIEVSEGEPSSKPMVNEHVPDETSPSEKITSSPEKNEFAPEYKEPSIPKTDANMLEKPDRENIRPPSSELTATNVVELVQHQDVEKTSGRNTDCEEREDTNAQYESLDRKEPASREMLTGISSRPTRRKKSLRDYNTNNNETDKPAVSKEDLVEVIKETKNREVKRLRSTLVQVDIDELTDEAISRLSNIAIVEPNDCLIRHKHTRKIVESDKQHPQWEGRRNFKNFVKVQPKYKHKETTENYKEGSSEFIRNSAFLITREYVPTKIYSKELAKKTLEDDLHEFYDVERAATDPPTTAIDKEDGVEMFAFSRRPGGGGGTNGLFVVDEDDSQNALYVPEVEEQNRQKSNNTVAVSAPIRIESSGQKRKYGNEMTISGSDYHEIDDDDDDDDDDEPKFKFKRRMR